MNLDSLKPYAKSLVGAITAGLTAYGTAIADGTVSAQEWIGIAVAVLAAGGIVFGVPNKDPQAAHQAESVQPPADTPAGDPKADAAFHDGSGFVG